MKIVICCIITDLIILYFCVRQVIHLVPLFSYSLISSGLKFHTIMQYGVADRAWKRGRDFISLAEHADRVFVWFLLLGIVTFIHFIVSFIYKADDEIPKSAGGPLYANVLLLIWFLYSTWRYASF